MKNKLFSVIKKNIDVAQALFWENQKKTIIGLIFI